MTSAPSGKQPLPIVVLISGNGSNLQSIIDAINNDGLPAEIRAVISNRPNAYGLERARQAGIPAEIVDHKGFAERTDFDHALQQRIDDFEPTLVVLAGFMRILTQEFVKHYAGRIINVHPSLLPKFTGLNTHQRAIDAGEKEHGASIHFVTDDLDGGPVIIQARLPILENDNANSLAARVQKLEHFIYPLVIRWFAENRLVLQDNRILLDNKPLSKPVIFDPHTSTI